MEDKEKKEYELSFLVKERGAEAAIEALLNQYGAEIINKEPAKEIRLFYPVEKYNSAHFGFFQFRMLPEMIEKITQSLKLNPAILRTIVLNSPIMKSGAKSPREKKAETRPPEEIAFSQRGMLTNEALEEKLEEILK